MAGTDPLAYSGLDADLRHLAALHCDGLPVPTAFTRQTLTGLVSVDPVDDSGFSRTLGAALCQAPSAIKVGMLHRLGVVDLLVGSLAGCHLPLVLDPVLGTTSSDVLLSEEGTRRMLRDLLPMASLVTPNRPEGSKLTGRSDPEEMAQVLLDLGASAVLIKGGHASGSTVVDVLYEPDCRRAFPGPRLSGRVPRGTGCALSTAIAAHLGAGWSLGAAVEASISLVREGIGVAMAHDTRFLVLPRGGAGEAYFGARK